MGRVVYGVAAALTLISLWVLVDPTALRLVALTPGLGILGEHIVINTFSSVLAEGNPAKLLVTLGVMLTGGPVVESRMGPLRLAVELVTFTFLAGFLVTVIEVQAFLRHRDERLLFAEVHGSAGLAAFFAVAAAQAAGNEAVVLPRIGPIPLLFQHLPFLVVAVFGVLSLLDPARDLYFLVFGYLFTWTYLRFLSRNADGTVGDDREEFAFTSLWPAWLRPVLRPLTALVGLVCLRCPCFRRANTHPAATAGGGGAGHNPSHGSHTARSGAIGSGASASPAAATSSTAAAAAFLQEFGFTTAFRSTDSMAAAVFASGSGGSGGVLSAGAGANGGIGGIGGSSSGSTPMFVDGTGGMGDTGALRGSGASLDVVVSDSVLDPAAERRRTRAMQALDKRLAEIEQRRRLRAVRPKDVPKTGEPAPAAAGPSVGSGGAGAGTDGAGAGGGAGDAEAIGLPGVSGAGATTTTTTTTTAATAAASVSAGSNPGSTGAGADAEP